MPADEAERVAAILTKLVKKSQTIVATWTRFNNVAFRNEYTCVVENRDFVSFRVKIPEKKGGRR
ncbi:MAG: hypothetical protein LC642_05290 [Verrucomicrobiaceae bacterium]|nr:hypothetical protein [Verrucomicrobiaceae bacterium]